MIKTQGRYLLLGLKSSEQKVMGSLILCKDQAFCTSTERALLSDPCLSVATVPSSEGVNDPGASLLCLGFSFIFKLKPT